MARTARALALVLLPLLALPLLCPPGRADDEPAPKPAGPGKADEPVSFVPSVKLLSAGAEPRKALRYKPTAGSKVDFAAESTVKTTTMMGPMNLGPIQTGVRVAFAKGPSEGTFRLDATITKSHVEDDGSNPMVSMIKASIESAKGQALGGEIDARGIWKADPLPGAGTNAQQTLRAHLLGMVPPLPEEALGVGAKWAYTVKIFVGNVVQTSVATMEITKIEGDRVEIAVSEKRHAKDAVAQWGPQEVPVPLLEGSGKGTLTLDLALGGAVASTMSAKTKMKIDFGGQAMEQTSEATTKLTGKAAAAATPPAK